LIYHAYRIEIQKYKYVLEIYLKYCTFYKIYIPELSFIVFILKNKKENIDFKIKYFLKFIKYYIYVF